MKFACLVYIDESLAGALSPEEHVRLTDKTIDDDWRLRDEGRLILAQPLQPPGHAVTLRARDGRITRTDGPFAETKEFMGGFWVIEAPDLDAALDWARRGALACEGPVEVRPFQEEDQAG
jgi:hypothetical protein